LFTTKEHHDPFPTRVLYATLDAASAKNEVHALHSLEFLMMSHIGVGRRMDALIIGDDFCGALLLRVRMINPTRFPRDMGYAGTMPKREIYFGFLHGGDTMEPKSCK
jgi:hypothetical protein